MTYDTAISFNLANHVGSLPEKVAATCRKFRQFSAVTFQHFDTVTVELNEMVVHCWPMFV